MQFVPFAPSNSTPKPCSPPLLKAERKVAWQAYKLNRSIHGRKSQQAVLALNQYLLINTTYRNLFVKSQIDYENSLSAKSDYSPKIFHKYIRGKKVGTPSVGSLRQENGDLTADCAEMAELFAASFSSVYTTQDQNSPFPHQVSNYTINDVDVSLKDVQNRLLSLDIHSSLGPDGLHPCLLKSCPNLAIPLYIIFRKSVSQGELPLDWKTSEIIPLFKKLSRHNP